MKFALKPFASLNRLVLAGLLATAGVSAMAQTPASTPSATPATAAAGQPAGPNGGMGGHGGRMGPHDPAKMQAWIARREANLKAQLKITPAQEGAWSTFTASMQPPARMGERQSPEQRAQQRAEMDQLTTPQRIDKMREMRTQRMTEMNAQMDKRGDAAKTFYATLTPDQQKTFDAEFKKMVARGPHGEHGGGPGHRPGPPAAPASKG